MVALTRQNLGHHYMVLKGLSSHAYELKILIQKTIELRISQVGKNPERPLSPGTGPAQDNKNPTKNPTTPLRRWFRLRGQHFKVTSDISRLEYEEVVQFNQRRNYSPSFYFFSIKRRKCQTKGYMFHGNQLSICRIYNEMLSLKS